MVNRMSTWLKEKTDWEALRPVQRGWLWASVILLALFTVLYLTLGMQRGLVWYGGFFHQSREGETLTYRGKWSGFTTEVTVSPEGTLAFYVDGNQYGPYQVRFDPEAAKIKGGWDGPVSGGVVVTQGTKELYKGAYYTSGDPIFMVLCAEKGPDYAGSIPYVTRISDNYKTVYFPVESLVYFALGEGMTRRADWLWYIGGMLMTLMNILTLLHAERLFHWDLSWHIRDAEKAEPTEHELTMRSVSAGLMFFAALFFYWMGLTMHQ